MSVEVMGWFEGVVRHRMPPVVVDRFYESGMSQPPTTIAA